MLKNADTTGSTSGFKPLNSGIPVLFPRSAGSHSLYTIFVSWTPLIFLVVWKIRSSAKLGNAQRTLSVIRFCSRAKKVCIVISMGFLLALMCPARKTSAVSSGSLRTSSSLFGNKLPGPVLGLPFRPRRRAAARSSSLPYVELPSMKDVLRVIVIIGLEDFVKTE